MTYIIYIILMMMMMMKCVENKLGSGLAIVLVIAKSQPHHRIAYKKRVMVHIHNPHFLQRKHLIISALHSIPKFQS
jgi:hypothetical protein